MDICNILHSMHFINCCNSHKGIEQRQQGENVTFIWSFHAIYQKSFVDFEILFQFWQSSIGNLTWNLQFHSPIFDDIVWTKLFHTSELIISINCPDVCIQLILLYLYSMLEKETAELPIVNRFRQYFDD